jgi:predicted signal transduction protein with EAL and GGDEF domain
VKRGSMLLIHVSLAFLVAGMVVILIHNYREALDSRSAANDMERLLIRLTSSERKISGMEERLNTVNSTLISNHDNLLRIMDAKLGAHIEAHLREVDKLKKVDETMHHMHTDVTKKLIAVDRQLAQRMETEVSIRNSQKVISDEQQLLRKRQSIIYRKLTGKKN